MPKGRCVDLQEPTRQHHLYMCSHKQSPLLTTTSPTTAQKVERSPLQHTLNSIPHLCPSSSSELRCTTKVERITPHGKRGPACDGNQACVSRLVQRTWGHHATDSCGSSYAKSPLSLFPLVAALVLCHSFSAPSTHPLLSLGGFDTFLQGQLRIGDCCLVRLHAP